MIDAYLWWWPLMADVAATDKGDGVWLSVGVIAAIGAAVAAVVKAFKAGEARGKSAQNVKLEKPVPTINTREEAAWATEPDLKDHVNWTREEFKRVWGQFGVERKIYNDELTNIHDRINKQSEATAAIKGAVEGIDQNVQQLLHLALHGKTPPRNRQ